MYPNCQRPLTRACALSYTAPTPIPCSLWNNRIGDQGAIALAAILNKTKITNLKCAAAPEFAFVSTPLDTTHHHSPLSRARSLEENHLGPKGGAALADGLKGNSTLKELK